MRGHPRCTRCRGTGTMHDARHGFGPCDCTVDPAVTTAAGMAAVDALHRALTHAPSDQESGTC